MSHQPPARPRDRADRMTKITTAHTGRRLPDLATVPDEVTPGGDVELQAYLQRMGYALTGSTQEHGSVLPVRQARTASR